MAEELSMDELQLEFERLQREERLVEEALEAENKRIRTEFLVKKKQEQELKEAEEFAKDQEDRRKFEEQQRKNAQSRQDEIKKKRKKSKIN